MPARIAARGERSSTSWLDSLPEGTSVLTTQAQPLSVLTRQGIHWTACNEPPSQTAAFIEHIGVDVILQFTADRGCPFLALPDSEMQRERVFGDGGRQIVVYMPSGVRAR